MNEVMTNIVSSALQGAGFTALNAEVSDDNVCTLTGTCRDDEALSKATEIISGFEMVGVETDGVSYGVTDGDELMVPAMQAAVAAAGYDTVEVVFDNGQIIVNGVVADDEAEDQLLGLIDNFGVDNVDWLVVLEGMDQFDDVEIEDTDDPSTYTVQKGDSWWKISKKVLGSGRKWKLLKAHNGSPKVIHPGQVLEIPDLDEA